MSFPVIFASIAHLQNCSSIFEISSVCSNTRKVSIFTARIRIRRMREGNIFSLFTLAGGGEGYPISGLDGGGVPHYSSRWGDTPSQVQTGGYPILLTGGVPHPRSQWVPPSAEWGTPLSQPWIGGTPISRMGYLPYPWVPPVRRMGYPPDLRWGVPPSKTGWGTPLPVSKTSTCYAAGGVPLAFTQEDFLVFHFSTFSIIVSLSLFL